MNFAQHSTSPWATPWARPVYKFKDSLPPRPSTESIIDLHSEQLIHFVKSPSMHEAKGCDADTFAAVLSKAIIDSRTATPDAPVRYLATLLPASLSEELNAYCRTQTPAEELKALDVLSERHPLTADALLLMRIAKATGIQLVCLGVDYHDPIRIRTDANAGHGIEHIYHDNFLKFVECSRDFFEGHARVVIAYPVPRSYSQQFAHPTLLSQFLENGYGPSRVAIPAWLKDIHEEREYQLSLFDRWTGDGTTI